MKKITNKTILKQGDKTYHPIEVDKVIYWYEDKQIPNAGYVKSICLGEIQSNIDYGVKLGDKQYVSPFVNKVGECYGCRKIVAQSQPKLEGIPVISLDSYIGKIGKAVEELMEIFNSMYTQKDIEKAIGLSREYTLTERYGDTTVDFDYLESQIIDHINSISVIEVDENFNIISYE